MLALVGSGEYLPPMEPVDRYLLAQLDAPAKVICLPTAAGTERPEKIEYWMELGVQHFSKLGVEVEALEITRRTHAHEPRMKEAIDAANFVYLSGGKPDYLYKTLEGTRVWQAIVDVHERGGIVAGCSAGAMIMGERVLGIRRLSDGFGLLPETVILPHFDEMPGWIVRLSHMLTRNYRLLGIEANTALILDKEEQRVVGSGKVTIIQAEERAQFSGGEIVIQASPEEET